MSILALSNFVLNTTDFGKVKKMRQQKPRVKKARKEPTHKNKSRNPPQITI